MIPYFSAIYDSESCDINPCFIINHAFRQLHDCLERRYIISRRECYVAARVFQCRQLSTGHLRRPFPTDSNPWTKKSPSMSFCICSYSAGNPFLLREVGELQWVGNSEKARIRCSIVSHLHSRWFPCLEDLLIIRGQYPLLIDCLRHLDTHH